MGKSVIARLVVYILLVVHVLLSNGCPTGYIGSPCRPRQCDFLSLPSNGHFVSVPCSRDYLSICKMKCAEGYEALGSTERQCILDHSGLMRWSGNAMSCVVIRCPVQFVQHADPPTGICSSVGLEYGTRCTFKCHPGYRLRGCQERRCKGDKTWSGTNPTCERILCPKLPPAQASSQYFPSACATRQMGVYELCNILCANGFTIEDKPSVVSFTLTCQGSGSWDVEVPKCRDSLPPVLTCPLRVKVNTLKGKSTGQVTWSVQVSDNSVDVDPNAVIKIESSHKSGQEFPIGVTTIRVTAIDQAGNKATCLFVAEVKDNEPPTCSACPADIVREETDNDVRVEWKRPVCSDNSGIPPSIAANRQPGSLFAVPSSLLVEYTISDGLNINKDCSFRITLKKKSCPLFAPPRNGALACLSNNGDMVCSVLCKIRTDFEFNPPLFYLCSGGKWDYISFFQHERRIPGPNCVEQGQPSALNAMGTVFFFDGDATDPAVIENIKGKFHDLLTGKAGIPSFLCPSDAKCKKENISVSAGVVG